MTMTACASSSGEVGAPCEVTSDCSDDLICDIHDGQGSCQNAHEHDDDTGHEHDDETGLEHDDETESGSEADLGVTYCSCMLVNCHDPWHEVFGEDDLEATMACVDLVESLPRAGEDLDAGNFAECRIHFCELAADDPTVCPAALGQEICV